MAADNKNLGRMFGYSVVEAVYQVKPVKRISTPTDPELKVVVSIPMMNVLGLRFRLDVIKGAELVQ